MHNINAPARLTALWSISLNVDCPNCKEYVNLLDYADFWDGGHIEPCEQRKNFEAYCPNCETEFEVDLEY